MKNATAMGMKAMIKRYSGGAAASLRGGIWSSEDIVEFDLDRSPFPGWSSSSSNVEMYLRLWELGGRKGIWTENLAQMKKVR